MRTLPVRSMSVVRLASSESPESASDFPKRSTTRLALESGSPSPRRKSLTSLRTLLKSLPISARSSRSRSPSTLTARRLED